MAKDEGRLDDTVADLGPVEAIMVAYRQANALDNRESLPVHVHDDPATARPPAWLAEIGPKGYACQSRATAREMKDDRPSGAARR